MWACTRVKYESRRNHIGSGACVTVTGKARRNVQNHKMYISKNTMPEDMPRWYYKSKLASRGRPDNGSEENGYALRIRCIHEKITKEGTTDTPVELQAG